MENQHGSPGFKSHGLSTEPCSLTNAYLRKFLAFHVFCSKSVDHLGTISVFSAVIFLRWQTSPTQCFISISLSHIPEYRHHNPLCQSLYLQSPFNLVHLQISPGFHAHYPSSSMLFCPTTPSNCPHGPESLFFICCLYLLPALQFPSGAPLPPSYTPAILKCMRPHQWAMLL